MAKTSNLAQIIADALNKGGDKVAYILGNEVSASDLTEFISTGSSTLDIAICNRKHGGIAVGRLTELQGLEGSGKSLVAAHMLADTQRRGGVAVLVDTETAFHKDFFRAVGIDLDSLVYIRENLLEVIFEKIEQTIEVARQHDKTQLVTIVIDSLAGATTEQELESDHGKEGYATQKAIILSKALRKITKMIGDQRVSLVVTNQLRVNLAATMPGQDKWTTSGGKAVGFHASTRIRFHKYAKIKGGIDGKEIIGIEVKAQVIKNRLGPPHREAIFSVYFDYGIDDHLSWFSALKKYQIIDMPPKAKSATWTDPKSGETVTFSKNKISEKLLNSQERIDTIYDQLAEATIQEYRSRE